MHHVLSILVLIRVGSGLTRGGSRIEFLGGTDDVGGIISGCGQLRLPDLFLRSQNFEG